jgi:hypothetical protein
VSCWQCHYETVLSADPWPERTSAIVRPAHGVHPLRHHWCRCPAELAGATGAAERRWCRAMAISAERNRALRLLAIARRCAERATEAIMLVRGFTTEMLDSRSRLSG